MLTQKCKTRFELVLFFFFLIGSCRKMINNQTSEIPTILAVTVYLYILPILRSHSNLTYLMLSETCTYRLRKRPSRQRDGLPSFLQYFVSLMFDNNCTNTSKTYHTQFYNFVFSASSFSYSKYNNT